MKSLPKQRYLQTYSAPASQHAATQKNRTRQAASPPQTHAIVRMPGRADIPAEYTTNISGGGSFHAYNFTEFGGEKHLWSFVMLMSTLFGLLLQIKSFGYQVKIIRSMF